MDRRSFLKTSVLGGAAMASGMAGAIEEKGSTNAAKLPRRAYGKTHDMLSVIGFGGIVLMGHGEQEGKRIVAGAFERGVNYFDVAPSYGDGEAEIKLGPALEPYRKDSFLACKTNRRERPAAEFEFNQSLERLRTDYFDLYQLHGIFDLEKDVEAVFKKGGVMDMVIEKKKSGQIRYLGFSAHSIDAAKAALSRYDFDSALFPVNFASWYKNDWGRQILEAAREKGAACLALKAMARQHWANWEGPERKRYPKCWYEPVEDREEAAAGLRWTLSQPVTAALPPGNNKLFQMALDIASESIELTSNEDEKLKALAQELDPLFPMKSG